MNTWIVRLIRRASWRADYVGSYVAASAAQALTIAGRDRYMRVVMDRKVVRVEAVRATEL